MLKINKKDYFLGKNFQLKIFIILYEHKNHLYFSVKSLKENFKLFISKSFITFRDLNKFYY